MPLVGGCVTLPTLVVFLLTIMRLRLLGLRASHSPNSAKPTSMNVIDGSLVVSHSTIIRCSYSLGNPIQGRVIGLIIQSLH
jgi:hypothetical protein